MSFVILATVGALLGAEFPLDAPIIPGATALSDPGRYSSPRSYDETVQYYERYFRHVGGVRWHSIVNLPGIKAKHIQSLRSRSHWEGLNIYDKEGSVRIYVLQRLKKDKSAKKPKR